MPTPHIHTTTNHPAHNQSLDLGGDTAVWQLSTGAVAALLSTASFTRLVLSEWTLEFEGNAAALEYLIEAEFVGRVRIDVD